MPRSCLICGSARARNVFREFGIDVMRCIECGHVFSAFDGGVSYDAYYLDNVTDWDQPFWWDQAHRAMYTDFSRRFLEGRRGRLLDVGCGLGFFVRHAASSGWEAHGSEISPEAVRFARTRLGLQTIRCGPLADAGFEAGSFDLITLWDVIEHIPNPDELLTHARKLLKRDGWIFLHTPNADVQLAKARLKRRLYGEREGTHYLEARDHLHLYTMPTLRRLLERNGFDQVRYFHLRPIQSVSGSRSLVLRGLKNAWHQSARALFAVTGLNFGNLFAAAKIKSPGE